MGQAKLKREKPGHRAGPHGHKYYCRNRCGTVVHWKSTNETFNERPYIPFYGWCEPCKALARAAAATEAQVRKDLAEFNRLSPTEQDATMSERPA